MGKSGFGERLRRERELRGVSRDEVCAATRIGTRFVEALETEQWGILPGGIFNRGFVRSVARFLGLDEDDLLAEYDLAMIEQHSQVEASLSAPPPPQPARKRKRHPIVLGTACAVLLIGMGWLGWNWHYRRSTNASTNIPSVIPTAVQPQVVEPPENSGAASSAPRAAAASPQAAGAQPLQLKIEAGKETTLSVSADGSKIFEGNMIAGQSRTFTAQDAIDISAKDAGALLLELNGQTLAPLGAPGQPGNVTLTRSDLKPTGGGAD